MQKLIQSWTNQSVQLIPDRLPEQLNIDLPIPEKATIVGSIIYTDFSYSFSSSGITSSSEHHRFEIIFDVPQPPEEAQTLYSQQLIDAGWQQQREINKFSTDNMGFLDSTSPPENIVIKSQTITFCSLSNKAKIDISPSYHSISWTETQPQLRLLVQVFDSDNDYNAECVFNKSESDNLQPLLPSLISLPEIGIAGRFVTYFGVQADPDAWGYAIAILKTTLATQSLIAHYANQLKKAGWILQEQKKNGDDVLITWTVQDNNGNSRQGILSITKSTVDMYIAYLAVPEQ